MARRTKAEIKKVWMEAIWTFDEEHEKGNSILKILRSLDKKFIIKRRK